jgi:hypothetical protein
MFAADFTPEENFQMDICGAENKSGSARRLRFQRSQHSLNN